jgi:hypothetical protein
MGIGLEYAQGATAYRSLEVADIAADTLGVGVGWLAAPPRSPNALALLEARMPNGDYFAAGADTTTISASMTPAFPKPSAFDAASDTSPTRSPCVGPRSLTRSSTLLPLALLVTLTFVPNGKVLCAIVSASGLKRSPLAVLRPANLRPY